MRNLTIILIAFLAGCANTETRDRSDSAARNAGRAAHKIVDETKKAAEKAGREIEKAGREAREGWKDKEREKTNQKDSRKPN